MREVVRGVQGRSGSPHLPSSGTEPFFWVNGARSQAKLCTCLVLGEAMLLRNLLFQPYLTPPLGAIASVQPGFTHDILLFN